MSLVQGRDATSVNLGPGSFKYVSLRFRTIDCSLRSSFSYAYVAGMAEPGCLSLYVVQRSFYFTDLPTTAPPDSVPVTSPANSYSAVTHLARAAMSNVVRC